MFNAIIIGSTGATGKCLLNHLINNPNCNKVTSIGRKSVNGKVINDKLVDVVIESLFFLDSTLSYWEGNDIFFNCMAVKHSYFFYESCDWLSDF